MYCFLYSPLYGYHKSERQFLKIYFYNHAIKKKWILFIYHFFLLEFFLTVRVYILTVQVRINLKILLLTFQCLHDMAPTYLKELLVQYVPFRNLRSSHRYLLQCPKFSTKYYGKRTFLFAAASLWNTLPIRGVDFGYFCARVPVLIFRAGPWYPRLANYTKK